MNKARDFLGHSRNDGGFGVPETVGQHVRRVSELATGFATQLGIRIAAQASAELHDLGKYSPKFNGYVQGMPGFASPDHWSAGARLALALILGGTNNEPAMRDAIRLAIESHHTSLTCLDSTDESMLRLDDLLRNTRRPICEDISKFVLHWREDGFDHNRRTAEKLSRSIAGAMLDVRMLFSCLVDADFLATEAHFNGNAVDPYRPRSPAPTIDFAIAANHVECFVKTLSQPATKVQSVRDELRRCCVDAAADLNPHQIEAALFALQSPLSKGVILADEVGLGKTIEAGIVLCQRWAERKRKRKLMVICPGSVIIKNVDLWTAPIVLHQLCVITY